VACQGCARTGDAGASNAQHGAQLSQTLLHGLLTNVTNPKGVIFMVAVLPQFIVKDAPLLPQLLILGLTICVIDIIVMHAYALAASSMQRFFRNAHSVKKQNRFFGGLFIAIGTGLFFVKRGPVT